MLNQTVYSALHDHRIYIYHYSKAETLPMAGTLAEEDQRSQPESLIPICIEEIKNEGIKRHGKR